MRPVLVLPFLALTLFAGASASAQKSKPLVVEKVDENRLVTLRGNTPPAAIAKNDLGPVSASMPMTDLILVLRRSPEMQAEFDAFVESQYEANSPNFHQWLTPEQIGERFGPALEDIAKVTAWLSSRGLSVDEVSKDRMTIHFSGSASRVQAAFHTELHNLSVKGQPHFSNMTDPQIPMALEPVVLGPKALSNFIPRPLHRQGGKVTLDRDTGKWQRVGQPAAPTTALAGAANGLRPEIGFSCGTNCQVEDMTPYDFATIYNLAPLWNNGIDGTGQTVAIAGRSDVRATDVSSFRSTFGLSGGTFNTVHNGTDPGYCTAPNYTATVFCVLDDQIENALDVEWAGATAPKANVTLVVTQQTNTNDAIYESANYVIQHNTAKIINVSYGNCELFMGTNGNTAYNSLWQSAAAAGISVFVASGDAGSPACDQGGDASGTPYSALDGLAVNGLASSTYNTAVGGTDLNWGSTASPYWNATNDSTNGSSAKGYMPEFPWNNSCTTPLAISYVQSIATQLGLTVPTDADSACNFVALYYQPIYANYGVDISWLIDTSGAGGGASNCTVNSTTNTTQYPDPTSCSGGYAKPSWQTGVAGIPNDGKRDLPDISFFSGNGLLGSAYLICVTDWGTCVTKPYPATSPSVGEIGGTSASSPAMAGIMALINQKAGSAQGNPNSTLYKLGAQQSYASCSSSTVTNSSSCYFNDVNTGTISMPCTIGSPNCTTESSADLIGVLSGFDAGVGFDNATGLGSLNVANVANGWTSSIGTATATVTVTPTPGSITTKQSLSVAVTVSGSSGTPTGTVTLSGGGYTSSATTLSSGSATITVPANSFSTGSITLTASYSGDPTYATATGTNTVTVTVPPTPTVTVSPASSTIIENQSLSVPITVSGTSGTATGTVTLSSGSYTSSAQTLSSGTTTFTIPANSLSVGTATLTATYSGDSTYAGNTGTAQVTVNAAPKPTVTVSPASSTIIVNQSLSVPVTIVGSNGTATGTVTLSGGGYTSSAQTLSSGAATFTIPANSLSVGTVTLTATYSGDSTYGTASGTASVTVNPLPTPTVTVSPASSTIIVNQSLSVPVTIVGSNGTATGTVTLSGGGYTSSAQTLSSGAATFTIPANSLSIGSVTLTAAYSGNSAYGTASGTATITVNPLPTPTVTVTPASSATNSGKSLSVTATVAGTPTPTGTATLTSGSYTSSVQTLAAGSVTFSIPANTLSAGTATLTVNYSGDSNYKTASGTANVTVTQSTYTLAATAPTAISRGGSAASTITWTTANDYSANVTLSSCTLNAGGPANSSADTPKCTVTSAAFGIGGSGTATVTTKAATTAALQKPNIGGWTEAGGGALLALLVFLGIPARSRGWRGMVGMFVLLLTLGGLAACGGGGGSGGGGGGGGSDPGTASGTYTFTVNGTGSDPASTKTTTTFTVTVN
jgi:hypothetical protein